MARKMSVLSIDWDYFVKATAGQRAVLFPDGGTENLSMMIQNYIWQQRYGTEDELESIGIDTPAADKMVAILVNRTIDTKVEIVESHVHIYDFVKSNYEKGDYSGLDIVNIDFHHDYYNRGGDLNCGNWVNALYDTNSKYRFSTVNKNRYRWVCREDSDKSPELEKQKWFSYMELDEVSIEVEPWDLIYICRSGMWSPPHLDVDFENLYMPLTFTMDVLMQQGLENRYTKEFKAGAEDARKQMEELRRKMG